MLLILLFSNQVFNDNVSAPIRFLVVESENVSAIAVIGNMVIYEEGEWKLWIRYPLNRDNVLVDEDLKGDILMPKPLHRKINKRILRLEFTEIAPPAFIPDGDMQTRFGSGAFSELVLLKYNVL